MLFCVVLAQHDDSFIGSQNLVGPWRETHVFCLWIMLSQIAPSSINLHMVWQVTYSANTDDMNKIDATLALLEEGLFMHVASPAKQKEQLKSSHVLFFEKEKCMFQARLSDIPWIWASCIFCKVFPNYHPKEDMHTHTHIKSHTQKFTHSHTPIFTQTQSPTQNSTEVSMCIDIYICTYIHKCANTDINILIHTTHTSDLIYTYTNAQTLTCAHMHTWTQSPPTNTHTSTHTQTHALTHIHNLHTEHLHTSTDMQPIKEPKHTQMYAYLLPHTPK